MNEVVSKGDIVRVTAMDDLNYFVAANGNEPLYGYVYERGSHNIRITCNVKNGGSQHFYISGWEIVSRASDEESPEVTAWKTALYAALILQEKQHNWCRRWRDYAPTFGFSQIHFPPKRLKVSVYIDSDLKDPSDGVTIREAATAFAETNGYAFAGNAELVD